MNLSEHRKRVEKDPDNELFQFSFGQACFAEKQYAEAIVPLTFCAEKKPEWMVPRILLGKAYLELGRKDRARPFLDAALKLAGEQHHEGPEEEIRGLLQVCSTLDTTERDPREFP